MKQLKSKNSVLHIQVKTHNSQQSAVDMFSKIQVQFLENLFGYNLNDYFPFLTNIYEGYFYKKINNKRLKHFASKLYLSKASMSIDQFQNSVRRFYEEKSFPNADLDTFPLTFKFLYCNIQDSARHTINQEELIFVSCKLKAEIEKMTELPSKIIAEIQQCQQQGNQKTQYEAKMIKLLQNYSKEYVNVIIVYYGDINFHLFNKKHYEQKYIKLMNKRVKVRFFVFFISKIIMIQTFKHLSKIQHIEYINDLMIQTYQFRRQKQNNKKNKQAQSKKKEIQPENSHMGKLIAILSISGIAIGFVLYKFFI